MVVFLRILCGGYAGFWILMGTLASLEVVQFGLPRSPPVVGVLMLLNGLALALATRYTLRGNRLVDYGALVLFAANALLSITDEIGPFDWASLLISVTLLLVLALERRKKPSVAPPLLLMLLILGLPESSYAQSMTAEFGGVLSGQRELDGAPGLGLILSVPTASAVELTGHFRHNLARNEWRRSSCSGLILPGQNCVEDLFEGDFSLTSAGGGVLLNRALAPRTDMFFGVDYSRYWIKGKWKGKETGSRVGIVPDEPGSGWGFHAGLFRRFWTNAGMRLSVRYETPRFASCGADAYFPFCEHDPITSASLGIQWRPVR